MSKANERSRWTLPDVVNPATSICFQVPVPNNVYHIAAFKGAMFELAKAYSWGNDTAHTAKDVAAVWLDIFNNLEECTVADQFRQYDDCTLQISHDGGATWIDLFSASACVAAGILDKLDDGTLAPGGQQEAGGSGVPNQCYTYHVQLNGNGRWKSPIPLQTGDLITVTSAQGGWYDGNAITLGQWNCPDGSGYVLGSCGIASVGPVGTDPAPSLNHMRLIGNIATETAPYFDMYNTSYSVANSATPQEFYLQANDSALDDNQGSITLVVEICKGDYVALSFNPTYGTTGPSRVAVGDLFTLTCNFSVGGPSAHSYTEVTFDRCCKIEVVSSTMTPYNNSTYGDVAYQYMGCDPNELGSPSGTPVWLTPSVGFHGHLDFNSTGTGTITLRILAAT